jgi:hypothetical protein
MFARESGLSNQGLVKNRPTGAGSGARRPDAGHCFPADPAVPSLDHRSIPLFACAGSGPEVRIPMSSRSVRPAGNRHSCSDGSAAVLIPTHQVPATDARGDQAPVPPAARPCRERAERRIRWHAASRPRPRASTRPARAWSGNSLSLGAELRQPHQTAYLLPDGKGIRSRV